MASGAWEAEDRMFLLQDIQEAHPKAWRDFQAGCHVIAREYVTMKGTRSGVLVSMSEECAFSEGLEQLRSAVSRNREFFATAPVSLEMGWREVREDEYEMLVDTLASLGVRLLGIISTSLATRRLFEEHGVKAIIGSLGLAKHGARARFRGAAAAPAPEPVPVAEEPVAAEVPAGETATEAAADEQPAKPVDGEEAAVDAVPEKAPLTVDDALAPALADPTLIVRKTIRSGQCVEFPGNIVVLGDVNAGAEVRAGGDVVVLGHLRGMAHAGVGGKQTASVLALNLHAPRVRIGDLVAHIDARKAFQNNAAVLTRIEQDGVTSTLYGN